MLSVVGFILFFTLLLVFLPGVVYPPLTSNTLRRIEPAKRIELQQAQSQVQNTFRAQLLQGLAGLVVVGGAAVGWQQLRLAREGHVTDRFTAAIDHLGSDTLAIRLGGIYALERLGRNSAADRSTITYILGAFIREHVPWPVGEQDGPEHPTAVVETQLPWLTKRAPDVWAALRVLSRRSANAEEQPLYLARTDLRRAVLAGMRLEGTILRHCNLAGARMQGVDLTGADLTDADLREVDLRGANLTNADLRGAHLQGANLVQAVLLGADLRGANLTDASLDAADLAGIVSDNATVWPSPCP
ncbi:pentapeptide repeat-containing protein [Streptomyces coeruleorubidus]|uniref:pentapeptide repeat-containing protein n=1 Tax=Streptomyces coeruleorubidus TaxID=116188 RepID=UPI0033AEC3EE